MRGPTSPLARLAKRAMYSAFAARAIQSAGTEAAAAQGGEIGMSSRERRRSSTFSRVSIQSGRLRRARLQLLFKLVGIVTAASPFGCWIVGVLLYLRVLYVLTFLCI